MINVLTTALLQQSWAICSPSTNGNGVLHNARFLGTDSYPKSHFRNQFPCEKHSCEPISSRYLWQLEDEEIDCKKGNHYNCSFFLSSCTFPTPSPRPHLWDLSSLTRKSNLCPLQWKGRVLTIRPLGKTLNLHFFHS